MPEITQVQLRRLLDTRRKLRELERLAAVCRGELLALYDAQAAVEPGPLQIEVVSRNRATVPLAAIRVILGDDAADTISAQLEMVRYLLVIDPSADYFKKSGTVSAPDEQI